MSPMSGMSVISDLAENDQFEQFCVDFGRYVANVGLCAGLAGFAVIDRFVRDVPFGRFGVNVHVYLLMSELSDMPDMGDIVLFVRYSPI